MSIDYKLKEKHAYLILSDSVNLVLNACLRLIDDKRNDIYILFDKKSHISDDKKKFLISTLTYSKLEFLPEITVNWGGRSQIEAPLILLEFARKQGYIYYHFFQGSDLPIKSQNAIHDFFANNYGKEFIQIEKKRTQMAENKVWYWHWFCHNRFFRKNIIMKMLNFGFVKLQKVLGVSHNRDIQLYQGSALFSITDKCADYVLSQKNWIKRRFRFSLAADEVYLQTLLMNSNFCNSIAEISSEVTCNARLIDRTRPDGKNSPHIWRYEELTYILEQPANRCFARKFDEKIDLQIINAVLDALL